MQMKSLYYLDAPRVLSLALFPHTSIDDGLFPNVPNDDDAPTCYYCDDALHVRPQVCTREGRLDSSAAHVCYDCARAEFGAHCRGCQDFTKYPH